MVLRTMRYVYRMLFALPFDWRVLFGLGESHHVGGRSMLDNGMSVSRAICRQISMPLFFCSVKLETFRSFWG